RSPPQPACARSAASGSHWHGAALPPGARSRWWLGYRRSSLLHASILTRQSPPRSPRLQKAGAVLYSSARDVFIQRLFQFLQVPVTVLLLRHQGAALGPLIPRVDEQSRRGQPALIELLQPAADQVPKRLG